jgi:hypothetical protein
MQIAQFIILAILVVVATVLVTLVWLGRRLSSTGDIARSTRAETARLVEESVAVTREQIALQTETNKLMRELIAALRDTR